MNRLNQLSGNTNSGGLTLGESFSSSMGDISASRGLYGGSTGSLNYGSTYSLDGLGRGKSTDSAIASIFGSTERLTKYSSMRELSTKVFSHRLYVQAAEMFSFLMSNKKDTRSPPTIDSETNKREVYVLAFGAIKYQSLIDEVLDKIQFFVHNYHLLNRMPLLYIVMYDFIKNKCQYGHGGLFAEGEKDPDVEDAIEAVESVKTKISAAIARRRIKTRSRSVEGLLPEKQREKEKLASNQIRYVRINTGKISVPKVILTFQEDGFTLLKATSDRNVSLLDVNNSFRVDRDFEKLLAFSPDCVNALHSHHLVKSGHCVLQDKASCFVSHVFYNFLGNAEDAIDAFPGLGSKVLYLGGLMGKKGKLFALAGDERKKKVLERNVELSGMKNINVSVSSFLDVNPLDKQFSKVRAVICDPLNTGSGILDPLDSMAQEGCPPFDLSHGRPKKILEPLIEGQLSALLHAFKFPQVRVVIYWTRSIYPEENEMVVEAALNSPSGQNFQLAHVFPSDSLASEQSQRLFQEEARCLRIEPSETMNGCFMACFERIGFEPGSGVASDKTSLKKIRKSKSITNLSKTAAISKSVDTSLHKMASPKTSTRKFGSSNSLANSKALSKSVSSLPKKRVTTIMVKDVPTTMSTRIRNSYTQPPAPVVPHQEVVFHPFPWKF